MASKVRSKPEPPSILRRKQVELRTGLSRSTIYLRVREGSFPRPINLGGRAVGWVNTDIDQWVEQQIERSRLPT
jgi:prophage regulatory protein